MCQITGHCVAGHVSHVTADHVSVCLACHCVAGHVSVCIVAELQVRCQLACHCVAGDVSVCYMSLCCRYCVSVLHATVLQVLVSVFPANVLQVLCQCMVMSVLQVLCRCPIRHCVASPVSVCFQVSLLQDLCQCVGARYLQEAVDRCLCGDRMPDTAYLHTSRSPASQSLWSRLHSALRHWSTHLSGQHALGQLALWWHRLGRDHNMTRTLYDRLLARSVILLNKLIKKND